MRLLRIISEVVADLTLSLIVHVRCWLINKDNIYIYERIDAFVEDVTDRRPVY
jgi:hypothetical protein